MSARYAFYPGCTLHSTGVEFGASTELVCQALGLELVEIPDWNCCGASSAHSMDHTLFLALPARNLAKAVQVADDGDEERVSVRGVHGVATMRNSTRCSVSEVPSIQA